ncbi:MAG: hypothetical protein QM756_15555 [Polyangiaceae bacterium]
MKKTWVVGVTLATVVASTVLACAGGTETDNPDTVQKFVAGQCKTSAGAQALLTDSDTQGLQCVEWSTLASGNLSLRLLNFPEPCGEKYLGQASLTADGSLDAWVYKDTCQVYRCGTCVFDFEYELKGIDTAQPLPLRIGSAVCAEQTATFADNLTLPLDTQPRGALCRPLEASALHQWGLMRGLCSQRNMPCGTCNGTDVSSCAEGLVCTQLAASDARCLAPCTLPEDCPDTAQCQDSVCRAKTSF